MPQSIVYCVGTRYRKRRSGSGYYREFQSCIYGAQQYSRCRFKWVYVNSVGVWRFNERDAIQDAKEYAGQRGMEYVVDARPGGNVNKSLQAPEADAGLNYPQQSK